MIACAGDIVKLSVLYMMNDVVVTGLINLSCKVMDVNNNILLTSTPLVESVDVPGEYIYKWNTGSMVNNSTGFIYYMRDANIIDIDEITFENVSEGGAGEAM